MGKLSLAPIVLKGYLLNRNAFGPRRRLPVGHTPRHSVGPLTPTFSYVSTLPAHLQSQSGPLLNPTAIYFSLLFLKVCNSESRKPEKDTAPLWVFQCKHSAYL